MDHECTTAINSVYSLNWCQDLWWAHWRVCPVIRGNDMFPQTTDMFHTFNFTCILWTSYTCQITLRLQTAAKQETIVQNQFNWHFAGRFLFFHIRAFFCWKLSKSLFHSFFRISDVSLNISVVCREKTGSFKFNIHTFCTVYAQQWFTWLIALCRIKLDSCAQVVTRL